MRRPAIVGLAALVVLLALGAGGAYVYVFSGARTAPKPLALASPVAPAATSAAASAAAGGSLAGSWTVSSGSQAGYRVKEQFAGQTSQHEAVARTSDVAGGVTVRAGASGLEADGLRFAAQLANLQSVDQVAGYNVSQRDRFVSRSLDVSQYPDAVFQAASVAVPASLATGGTATLMVAGQLTIHGTTRSVDANVQARLVGSALQIAGQVAVVMTDFGVTPPQAPFTVADSHVTIEFQLVLNRTG